MQNFIKTIINAVQSWTKKEIKNEINNIPIMQPNWNQNDANAADYVKNRTHWVDDIVKEVVLKKQAVTNNDYLECELIMGQTYEVLFDNQVYQCTSWLDDCLGNGDYVEYFEHHSNEPFCIYQHTIYTDGYGGEHTIEIIKNVENIHKLDPKYLDIPANLATTDDVQEALDVANNAQDIASNAQDIASGIHDVAHNAMTKVDPKGEGTFTFGYDSNSNGKQSIVIGNELSARHKHETVLGSLNEIDDAKYGIGTNIADRDSVMLVNNTELYVGTGYSFNASTGKFSLENPKLITIKLHALFSDNNIPKDGSSFYACRGDSDPTAAEFIYIKESVGWRISGSSAYINAYKLVPGDVNNTKGKYVLTVGNGYSYKDAGVIRQWRSNAHTLDWDGVGWYQGGLQVGGNAQDDGAKNVLLEGDAIPVPSSAITGQILAVKSVDANGKPTEWETVDASSGGESAYPGDDHINDLIDTAIDNLEIPQGGSNQPLTFTGAVNATYDGSEAVTVNIPSGGGGEVWEYIGEFNVGDSDVEEWIITEDAEEEPIELKKMYFNMTVQPSTATTDNTPLLVGNPAYKKPFATNVCYASMGAGIRTSKNIVTLSVEYIPTGDTHEILAHYGASTYNVTWTRGRSPEGSDMLKNCIGGLAVQTGNTAKGKIGAGSTVKIWGVRV